MKIFQFGGKQYTLNIFGGSRTSQKSTGGK
jgi:hypothetical protein